jgi:Uma2 family endonuclease
MLSSIPKAQQRLPGSEDLPCSDDTPVDNEGQNTIPNGLLATLEAIWADRQDWFFGVDMGIYDRQAQQKRTPRVVPDGFLSLGVQRHKREGHGRLSYVLQEENNIVPSLALEFVSKTYGQEYDQKKVAYGNLGVLYYLIYNPEHSQRDQHQPWELYKLVQGSYELQGTEPFWMPEIGLGIGRVQGRLGGIEREWLAWHDAQGNPYPLPQELIQRLAQQLAKQQNRAIQAEQALTQQQNRADQAEQALAQEYLKKQQLLERLRQMGIELEDL